MILEFRVEFGKGVGREGGKAPGKLSLCFPFPFDWKFEIFCRDEFWLNFRDSARPLCGLNMTLLSPAGICNTTFNFLFVELLNFMLTRWSNAGRTHASKPPRVLLFGCFFEDDRDGSIPP